jgi:non-ribosomal peptide synthetase-like protein
MSAPLVRELNPTGAGPLRSDHCEEDPSPSQLHELFEAQADTRPSQLAVVCGPQRLTYEDLERAANRLAHRLVSHGIGPGQLVGILFRPSEKPILAMLGVLKAGAAYLPLDPSHPADRIEGILSEAKVELLLTEVALEERARALFSGPCVAVETVDGGDDSRIHPADVRLEPEDLCYVLYTSGSTGRPKGVMAEHRNAVGFVAAFRDVCRLTPADRVYQGFALGFDGSVEEIWMALSSGATLVVPGEEVERFGDEVARFLERERITCLSTVPTMLSTVQQELPALRLLIVSGEPCPPELVSRCAKPGRRMLNVYGPTETTVNATAAECRPGEAVTIGRPLAGYRAFVLDEDLQPVAQGDPGELYIGGVGVARGYLGQPVLTSRHFVDASSSLGEPGAKLYRTGDRVRATSEGDLLYLGRLDSQVKIRGYRIELGEIEAVLLENPEIRTAVATVVQRGELPEIAAFVVLRDPSGNLDRGAARDLLRSRLPAPMIPSFLDVVEEIPTLSSGKADRNRLPEPEAPLARVGDQMVAPQNELERCLAATWARLFELPSVSVEDDFFLDLGGYSLLAAQMVSTLRREHGLDVAIRDVYQHATVRKLARHLSAAGPAPRANDRARGRPTSREVLESLPRSTRWACTALQVVSLYCLYGLVSAPLLAATWVLFGLLGGQLALGPAAAASLALLIAFYPALLLVSVALKWLIIGRYRTGRYPVRGLYFYRWWLATRVHAMSGIGLLSGTPLMSLYYRLMGARVGKGCIIDTPHCGAFDLVSIGDLSSIGAETQVLGHRIEDGMLLLGRIEVGNDCFVGIHSALGLDTRMGDGAKLDDMSLLADGEVIEPGGSRRGSPARSASVSLPELPVRRSVARRPVLFGLLHLLAAEGLLALLLVGAAPGLAVFAAALTLGGAAWALASLPVVGPVTTVSLALVAVAAKALLLRRTRPGVYPVESFYHLRKWTADALLRISRAVLHPLYTTIYLPSWLRLLGARIGPRAEISTVSQITPDLVTIEEESFFADGSIIGGRHVFGGYAHYAASRIGKRSFVGNSAILPPGAELGGGCLLGVLSAPPVDQPRTPDGSEWLGSPAFRLPHRKKVEGFDATVTYRPTPVLYAKRLLIDALRILIPSWIGTAGLALFFWSLLAVVRHLGPGHALLLAPLLSISVATGAALCVVGIKRLLMGRFVPVIKPLWSVYVWLNEVVNGAYETIAAPALAPMLGTPLFNAYLRLLGCKVGSHCHIGTTRFSEFDLVEIGDHAAINEGVVIQNHLFEDRIMKSSYLRIGDECSVGNMSVALYDSEMQQGSVLGPLSLLMKGETLPPATSWSGIPNVLLPCRRERSGP